MKLLEEKLRAQNSSAPEKVAVTDGELLLQFSRYKDQQAFTELVNRHARMVLAVCRQVVRDHQEAEDVFQDHGDARHRQIGRDQVVCGLFGAYLPYRFARCLSISFAMVIGERHARHVQLLHNLANRDALAGVVLYQPMRANGQIVVGSSGVDGRLSHDQLGRLDHRLRRNCFSQQQAMQHSRGLVANQPPRLCAGDQLKG